MTCSIEYVLDLYINIDILYACALRIKYLILKENNAIMLEQFQTYVTRKTVHCNSQKLEFPIYEYAHGWNTRCCALEWSLRSHGDDDKQAGLKLSQITRPPQITLVVRCHRSTSN